MRLLGKRVLIDVVEYDANNNERFSLNLVGRIVGVSTGHIEVECENTGTTTRLRIVNGGLFEVADAREYRMRNGGTVERPDLIARWTHFDVLSGETKLTVTDFG